MKKHIDSPKFYDFDVWTSMNNLLPTGSTNNDNFNSSRN